MELVNQLRCFLWGHRLYEDEALMTNLTIWRCWRCGTRFVQHGQSFTKWSKHTAEGIKRLCPDSRNT